jgi:hypothetical protein
MANETAPTRPLARFRAHAALIEGFFPAQRCHICHARPTTLCVSLSDLDEDDLEAEQKTGEPGATIDTFFCAAHRDAALMLCRLYRYPEVAAFAGAAAGRAR